MSAATRTRLIKAGSALATAAVLTAGASFVKELLTARQFGAGLSYDAYLVAFSAVYLVPTTLAVILQSTFVPALIEALQNDEQRAWALVGTVTLMLSAALLVSMGVLVMTENVWFSVVIPGFDEAGRREVTTIVELLLPLVWLIGLNELLKSLLNALRSFAVPAASQILPSMGALVGLLTLSRSAGVAALALGWLAGSVIQTGLLIGTCLARGVHFRLDLSAASAPLSNLAALSLPYVAVGLMPWAMLLIDQHFASQIGRGAISTLSYADKIFRLPLTVLVAALYTSVQPFFAQLAATERLDAFADLFRRMLRVTIFALLPIGVILVVLRQPVVALIYQRGAFGSHAAVATSGVLLYLGLLVPVLGAWYMYDRALTCLHRTHQLMVLAVAATALKLVLSAILTSFLGLPGLALATVVSFAASVVGMHMFLRLRLGHRVDAPVGSLARISLCALGAALVLWILQLGPVEVGAHGGYAALKLAFYGLIAISFYLVLGAVLGLEEARVTLLPARNAIAFLPWIKRRYGRLPSA